MGKLAGALAAFHVAKTAGLLFNTAIFPVLRPVRSAQPIPAISILVPARNEQDRLPRTLLGLLKQPAAEIVVLDDESSDRTADIVRELSKVDSRLRLVHGQPCPQGWIGKNWACHQLAQQAVGEVLVFCDADVSLRPGALQALSAQMAGQAAQVFSVFPRQDARSLGERMLVPLIDETLLAFLPFPLLGLPIPAAATANGQLIAFTREAYAIVGGHESVADEIVEDLALSRRARLLGLKLGLALGGDLVSARMYDSYPATVNGLGKSIRSAHASTDLLLVASALAHLTAYTMPWLRLRKGHAWKVAAALGLAERLITNHKTGRGSYAEAALVPFIAPAALPVYRLGLRDTARWKGREYP